MRLQKIIVALLVFFFGFALIFLLARLYLMSEKMSGISRLRVSLIKGDVGERHLDI